MKKHRSESADPQHFDALLDLGILKARGGFFPDALQLFSEALRVNPGSAEANLNLGNVLAETGRPEEALASYDQALAIRPAFAEALYGRGNALHDLKRYEEALASYDQAIAIMPRAAFLHNNRGDTLRELNRLEEALASLDRALAIAPDYVDALNNRGNTLQDLGRCEEALASFDRALAVTPDDADLHNNRGNTLRELKRLEDALASYDRAIAIMPGVAFLHNNRGNTLRELGRLEEALASLDIALALKPGYVEALTNRGNTLRELGRHDEALASFDLALASSPDDALVHHNRGNALQDLRRYEEALASFEKALAVRSGFAEALHGRGNALHKLGRFEEALASYEKALMIRPDLVEALQGRGIVLEEFQRYEEALASYRQALAICPDHDYVSGYLAWARMQCCDWRERDEEVGRLTADIRAGKRSINPFMFLGGSDSPRDQLLCSRIWVRDKCAASPAPIWKGERYRHERIRLAYLSADFREHPSSFLLAGVFEHHDRSRFETLAISFGPDDRSEIRARLKGAFEEFIDVRMQSDLEVARLMREREVDIAVDLMGHTRFSRIGILALRPAPVQVNFFCPGTSGADYLDYIVCDRVVVPEEHHPHYTEKVVYLPDTFQANDSRRRIAERTPSRAEAGLPEDGFVFCSFNNTYKFTPGMFDIWMRLLGRVEASVLWLQQINATAVKNLRREALERGIDASRLIFAPRLPRLEDHLARYRLADLFLDTLPYNAQTTASDALWAGLPVITCLGTAFVGRVAGSLLNAIGLNELITHSLEEYENLALELARNPQRLADLKSKLAQNRGSYPLFDTDRFCRHIEAAYTRMWERSQRGEPPAYFAVQPIDK